MAVLIKTDDVMKKYFYIWNKVSYLIRKELDCKPPYNKKFWEILKNIVRML